QPALMAKRVALTARGQANRPPRAASPPLRLEPPWLPPTSFAPVRLPASNLIPSITFAMSADCHICATVQSPVGNQREPVVRHDEAAWHLKEYRELAAREMLITLCRHASD